MLTIEPILQFFLRKTEKRKKEFSEMTYLLALGRGNWG